jgi:5-methyltetrahydrofolate--homocysteine methyltransferase
VARYPGVHISAGVSNVSFALPVRKLLNETFLLLLMAHGLDAAIVDPRDQQLMMNIIAAEALLGRDGTARTTCALFARESWAQSLSTAASDESYATCGRFVMAAT